MNSVAQHRIHRLETTLPASTILSSLLALNTLALFALDRLGGIPSWIKTAVGLFLAF